LITSIYFFYKKYTIEGNGAQNSLNKTIGEINVMNTKVHSNIMLKKPSGKIDLSKKLNILYKNLSNFFSKKNKNILVINVPENIRTTTYINPKTKSKSKESLIGDFDKKKFNTVTVEMLLKYLNYNRADLGITNKPPPKR